MNNAFDNVVEEISLECSDGVRIAAQSWKTTSPRNDDGDDSINKTLRRQRHRRILCLHGWMDNCRSFHLLAPALARRREFGSRDGSDGDGCHVVALDFPGHGLSSHRSVDAGASVLAELAFYVAEAVRLLQWDGGGGVVVHSEEEGNEKKVKTTNQKFALIGHR